MNKEKYTLQEVTTPALEREWLDFPKRIYKGNRNWVCPLDVDVLEVFNPSKNELFADGEAIRWVARDAQGRACRPHRGVLQPREGFDRGAAHGRLRVLRVDRRPAGRRHAVRSLAHVAGQPRHGGHGRPDQLRTAARLVGAAGRGLRIPAPLQESLQSALLQGVVRKLWF